VIEVLPKEEWKVPSKLIVQSTNAKSATDSKASAKANDASSADASAPEVFQDQGEEPRPSGRVVGIVKRSWKPYCGSIESAPRGQYMLFIAADRAIPKIRIKTRQVDQLRDKRIVVVIDKWDAFSVYPSGHYVREIGKVGDKTTETDALLIQYDVPFHPFSQNVLACLPDADWKLTDDELKKRLDLREINICSIDPPGCTDIDDALHVQVMPNGNYQVGVHIADVSHFVKPNTAIDDEAAARSTTVYLCDRRIDMLPPLLGTNLCSLKPYVERLAFSVIWEMTTDAEIVSTFFTKSVIRSKAAFTYAEAQNRIDDLRQTDPLSKNVRILNSLAKILKKKRMEAGALTLASPEVRFTRSEETQDPIDMELYETKESNSLVEEFMLLANCSVAAKIYSAYPNFAMLRRHPTPPEKNFIALKKSARLLGIELDTSSSKALADSLDVAVSNSPDSYMDKLVRIMTTRCMSQAVYFSSGSHPYNEFHHYGLAAPIYTHFTSPIRRYADVIVHRELSACIDVEPLPLNYDKEYVRKLCHTINHRHRMAQQASRASTELYTVIFFKGKVVREHAYITRVKANAFICIVPRYGIEGIVYVADKRGNTPFVFNDDDQSLTKGDVRLRMFDKISVQISVDMTNPHRPYLKIDCVSPPIAELLGGISAAPPPERMDEDEEEEDEEEDESEETKVGGETKKRKEPPTQPKQVQKTKAKAKGAAVPRPSKKHREGQ
jgi:exosome complex exonuclease DIS3/RRP44